MTPFTINAGIMIVMIIGLAAFDASLQLGQLQGAVFKLYLFYGSIALLVINIAVAGILRWRNHPAGARNVFMAGIIATAIGLLTAYVSPL